MDLISKWYSYKLTRAHLAMSFRIYRKSTVVAWDEKNKMITTWNVEHDVHFITFCERLAKNALGFSAESCSPTWARVTGFVMIIYTSYGMKKKLLQFLYDNYKFVKTAQTSILSERRVSNTPKTKPVWLLCRFIYPSFWFLKTYAGVHPRAI